MTIQSQPNPRKCCEKISWIYFVFVPFFFLTYVFRGLVVLGLFFSSVSIVFLLVWFPLDGDWKSQTPNQLLPTQLLLLLLFYIFIVRSSLLLSWHVSFSFSLSRYNSNPGSLKRLFSPLPTTVRAFVFIARLLQPFFPSSTRIDCGLLSRAPTILTNATVLSCYVPVAVWPISRFAPMVPAARAVFASRQ